MDHILNICSKIHNPASDFSDHLYISQGKYINQIEEYAFDLKNLETEIGPLKTNDGTPRKFAIHEALWQCQSLFNDAKGKVGFKKIMLFTSNDDPHANDPGLKRQAEKKSKDFFLISRKHDAL